MTAIDPVIENLAEIFGKAGAETVEDLIVAELDAALTAQFANGRANANAVTASDVVTLREFLYGMITLKQAYVGPHEMGSYMACVHPSTEYDLMVETNIGGWLDINSYAGMEKSNIMNGELGKVYGIRFVVSDKMSAAANGSSVSVKNNYLIGEECFGVVDLAGKNVDMVIKPVGSAGAYDPLNQFGTVGYKLQGFVAKNFAAARGIVIKGASNH
jgi:N4-gp56 family major capsid protein